MTESKTVVLVLFCLPVLQNLGSVMSRDPYFLKETEVIPRNAAEYMMMTADLKCEGKNMSVAYVLHSIEKKTLMVCTPNKNLSGIWCPEFNSQNSLTGKVQPKLNARCTNMSIAPCKGIYSVWDSYLFFECFQEFGGISSPMECVQNLKLCEERYKNASKVVDENENIMNEKQKNLEACENSSKNCAQMLESCEERCKNVSQVVDEREVINKNEMATKNGENTFIEKVYSGIMAIISLVLFCFLLYNCLILYLIKKFCYKEAITYRPYIESRKILLKNIFAIKYSISDVIREAPQTGIALGEAVMNTDKGKEVGKVQDVNVNIREDYYESPEDPNEEELRKLTVELPEDDTNKRFSYLPTDPISSGHTRFFNPPPDYFL